MVIVQIFYIVLKREFATINLTVGILLNTMNKRSKKSKQTKRPRRPSFKPKAVVSFVTVTLVVLGLVYLYSSKAASPNIAFEAESGTATSAATKIADIDASGANTNVVQFGSVSPPTGSCPSGQTGSPPNCVNVPAPVAAGKTWQLTFFEEFNGASYDPNKLTPCFDWNYGACSGTFNKGRDWYNPSQIVVNSGSAKLIATPGRDPNCSPGGNPGPNPCTYKSGLLSTARKRATDPATAYLYSFTYGYVEGRLKRPPATPGFFTAFWMLPANPSYNYRSEIDIIETLGYDPTTMYMTYHGIPDRTAGHNVNNGSGNNGTCPVLDYSKDFHRFGVDWQPTHIAWYIDGIKCGETKNTASIETGPMQIILNLFIDHSWEKDWGYSVNPTLTRQLEVDYLRVYQQK